MKELKKNPFDDVFNTEVDLCFIDKNGDVINSYCENKKDIEKFYKNKIDNSDYFLIRCSIINYLVSELEDLYSNLLLMSCLHNEIKIMPIDKIHFDIFNSITKDLSW